MIIYLDEKWDKNKCPVCGKPSQVFEKPRENSYLCNWFTMDDYYEYCSEECEDKVVCQDYPSKALLDQIQQNTGWKRL